MNEKILIVDDEPDILQILEVALCAEGYEVSAATCGEEALEKIKSSHFELMITDLKMPGMNGVELINKAKELRPEMECIVLTGYASIENAVAVLRQNNAFDFIAKPIKNLDEFFITIQRALEKQKLWLENIRLLNELSSANEKLESRVTERTRELSLVNTRLEKEILKRKNTQDTLKASERRYRFLAENMQDVLWTTDKNLKITYIGKSVKDLLGYETHEAMQKTPDELIDSHSLKYVKKAIAYGLNNDVKEITALEVKMIRKDGSPVWTEVIGSFIDGENGLDKGYMGVSRDITNRKKTEKAMIAAQSELEKRVRERTQELHDTRLQIIRRLGKAAEFKDEETGLHIIRMSRMCALLGHAMGLGQDECDLLLSASPMHDIGKIGIPDHILLKQGKLDKDEWILMKTHTTIGAELLSGNNSRLLVMAKEIALSHHEKYDGSGYPLGLAGEEIPLAGRLSAVCDVFDALISKRPYKAAWPVDRAMAEIKKEAGRHFDPHIAMAFEEILPQIITIIEEYQD